MEATALSYDSLLAIMGGHTAFQLLHAGVELGVFALLDQRSELPHDEIAEGVGLQPRPARILIDGLRTLRLIEGPRDGLRNAAIVDEMLTPGDGSWVDVVGWQHHIVYPGETNFVEALRRGENVGLSRFPGSEGDLYGRLAHNPELERVFHDAMSSLSQSANTLLVEHLDLTSSSHLVDAGGGDGTNAIAIARANPDLRVTVFDNPSVCAHARDNINAARLVSRVHTCPGDLFTDDLPQADAVLLAHMLTIWSPQKNTELLRRIHRTLPSGGRVIIFNMMANDDGCGPMSAALGSPYFLAIATGEGMLYAWREYEQFLTDAGFRTTERIALPRDHGMLVGVK